tara:strand:+ start:102 stop:1316 length:1215 start_codon:yes stop_codon:yes gene_type:complete
VRESFTFKDSIKSIGSKSAKEKKYFKKFIEIRQKIIKNLDTVKDTFHVLSEKFKLDFKVKDLKKFNEFKSVVIIGMGGSILGSEAIHQFLKIKIKKKIYFLNDINIEKVEKVRNKINLRQTLFIIISKSGSTVETISNFLSLNIIKKNAKNIILISEKGNNFIYNLSRKFNLYHIDHKKYIGGRYSVLSEVGIVPSYFMGINISELRKNLRNYFKNKKINLKPKTLISLASSISQKRFTNLIFLNYSPRIEKFLYWLQQLKAESLGKQGLGLFPAISNVPKDHHSLLQLYLDGPKDKIFYIFYSKENNNQKIKINKFSTNEKFLKNKTLSVIKNAQKNAVVKVFREKKIPFREFEINEFNERTLGELFSFFIIETAIIGKLLGINPFDQPAVERVKKITKKFLN